ncbi:hypothetical protein BC834DRAFT_829503 [Gloeopeniophorella convolvens]|nr:hypothetical protein BC834DRAFT_829503 [Gloeopeniophorella convolvens]
MEENQGTGRGSYIWGRSVHNTRIERLWVEVTRAFGSKWKQFFHDLEEHHGLDPDLPAHIWLVHHLFLPNINRDAQRWASMWNAHKLQLKGERNRTPRAIWTLSMITDGPRGVHGLIQDEDVGNLAHFGVEPDAFNSDSALDPDNSGEVLDIGPDTTAEVRCDAPECPLSDEDMKWLDHELRSSGVDIQFNRMEVLRLVWQVAVNLCRQIVFD